MNSCGNRNKKAAPERGRLFFFSSIPAKAGISAAIAAFADRRPFRFAENSRCRENEIPAFAGMEVLLIAPSLPPPIPAKAGISLSSNCFGARCQKTVREWGDSRFRGNGKGREAETVCLFLNRSNATPNQIGKIDKNAKKIYRQRRNKDTMAVAGFMH